jgi:dephospho-CoA kinase
MPLRVGLTGGIGSGKSVVAKVFETLGVPVYYADEAAKRVMSENASLRKDLVKYFGEEAYVNNDLNRKFISAQVFNNPEKLKVLNSLVHPVTLADADEWISLQTAPYVIKEAALIFESDAWKHLDKFIGVSAPFELRMQRAMQRDRVSAQQVQDRMDRQMNEDEKMKRCDYVIVNDETQLVIPQVLALHKILTAGA